MITRHTIKDVDGNTKFDVGIEVFTHGFVQLMSGTNIIMFNRSEAEELIVLLDLLLPNGDEE